MNPEIIACIACCAVAAVGGLAVLRLWGGKPQPKPPETKIEPTEAKQNWNRPRQNIDGAGLL